MCSVVLPTPGTPASSTTKTGRHDIAEILLKMALNTKNQSINYKSAYLVYQKWKTKNIGTFLKSNRKIIERGKVDIPKIVK